MNGYDDDDDADDEDSEGEGSKGGVCTEDNGDYGGDGEDDGENAGWCYDTPGLQAARGKKRLVST